MLRSQEHPRCELSVQVRGSLRQVHLSVSSKLTNTVWAFCTRGPGLHPACCMQLESRHIELHSTQSELIQFVRLHFSISLFLLLKMAANLKVCSTIFSPLHVLSALWISCLLFCLVKVKLSPKCNLGVFFFVNVYKSNLHVKAITTTKEAQDLQYFCFRVKLIFQWECKRHFFF